MTGSLLMFLGAAGVIVAAGIALTQFADLVSQRTGLGRMFVGSVLLAGATSLPELATDVSAMRMGEADLAVGDLFGSCLFNFLILAVLDLTRYSKGRMLSEISAAHALSASVSIALAAVVAIFLILGRRLESVVVLGVGPGSILVVLGYLAGLRLVFTAQKVSRGKRNEAPEAETYLLRSIAKLGLKGAITGYVVCAVTIVAAAPLLARSAAELAEQTGLGGTFFGTTFVALSTSLPEVVTTFTAVRMHVFDLAVGNIIGSNCFNLLLLGVLDAFDRESLFASVSSIHVFSVLAVILVTTVLVIGQLYRVERKRPFLEPDALLSIALILGTFAGLYFLKD